MFRMFREWHCDGKLARPPHRRSRRRVALAIAFGALVAALATSAPGTATEPAPAGSSTARPARVAGQSSVAAPGMRAEEIRTAHEVAAAVLGANRSVKQRHSEEHQALKDALAELRSRVGELRRAEILHFTTRRTSLSAAAAARASAAEAGRAESEQALRQALQGFQTRRTQWEEGQAATSMLARGGARGRLNRRLGKLADDLDRALLEEGAARLQHLRELEARLELVPGRRRAGPGAERRQETPTFQNLTHHGKAGGSHGKAGESHGKAGESHGKAGGSHGKAGGS